MNLQGKPLIMPELLQSITSAHELKRALEIYHELQQKMELARAFIQAELDIISDWVEEDLEARQVAEEISYARNFKEARTVLTEAGV